MADSRSITRRLFMRHGAAAGAALSTGPLLAVPAAAANDPLLDAILAFRDADARLNAAGYEAEADRLYSEEYRPRQEVLDLWDASAVSMRGAIEAIREARREADLFECSEMIVPMLTAALAYLEANHAAA